MSSSSWYTTRLLPRLLDFACGLAPITAQRCKVVPRAAGQVLEIGLGMGLNLRHYDASKVDRLVGIEPAEHMHGVALQRSGTAGLPLQVLPASAEDLPLDAASFDCVVCTYTLCSIANPAAALAEMRRVLRPGGRLLIAEHGLAPDAGVARFQRVLDPLWSRVAGGCHLTRDVPALLEKAGFQPRLETGYITRPHALAFNVWGEAIAP